MINQSYYYSRAIRIKYSSLRAHKPRFKGTCYCTDFKGDDMENLENDNLKRPPLKNHINDKEMTETLSKPCHQPLESTWVENTTDKN